MRFDPPEQPFCGAIASPTPAGFHAAIFGAPHGTPYPGVNNRVHAGTARALRATAQADWPFVGNWNFDFGGPLLGDHGFRLADLGDLATSPEEGLSNRATIEAATRSILDAGGVPIMLGGDDSVPIPFIAGFAGRGPLTIVQIDAHIDWRDEVLGESRGYSSTMRRVSEMAHVERIVQVGMRGLGSARRGEVEAAQAWGARLFTAREVHAGGIDPVLAAVPEGAAVLVTLDCDGLDPAAIPAVMAPTPGGLTYDQVVSLIGGLDRRARLVGFDLVEFVPERDPQGLGAITAASIVTHLIGTLANAALKA